MIQGDQLIPPNPLVTQIHLSQGEILLYKSND